MRCPLPTAVLVFASSSLAQAPMLHASEVGAHRQALGWLGQTVNQKVQIAAGLRGYDFWVFGADGHGHPEVAKNPLGADNGLDPQATAVLLLTPQRGTPNPGRMLFVNRGGRVFVGERPADATDRWQPTVETFAAPGVPATLNNMLLDSGTAQDGTQWQRLEALEAGATTAQRVRLVHEGATWPANPQVEIGASRLRWHPAWLPLGDLPVVAMRGTALPTGQPEGQSVAEGNGVPARDLHLHVTFGSRSAVLRPDDVTHDGNELRVTFRGATAEDDWLDDQGWAAHGLQMLAAAQLAYRNAHTLDRDGDGRGEFVAPTTALNRYRGQFQELPNGRFLFRNHLFAFHLADTPDGAEQHFVAYGWPAVAHDEHDLAFFVDERGIVHRCRAAGQFAGHDRAPSANSSAQAELGWVPLR